MLVEPYYSFFRRWIPAYRNRPNKRSWFEVDDVFHDHRANARELSKLAYARYHRGAAGGLTRFQVDEKPPALMH